MNAEHHTPLLRPYQRDGIRFLRENGRAFLADEPGLGKSVQLIEASEGRTLVVAPAMVLAGGTWEDETERWADDPLRFTTCPYSQINQRIGRKIQMRTPRKELLQHWDTLILDEAHYCKGRDTSWSIVARKIAQRADRVFLATGTPISNYAPDLFPLLQMLYPEKARGGGELGSYWRWAEQWFDTEPQKIYVKGEEREVPHVGDLLAHKDGDCGVRDCEHYEEFYHANLGEKFIMRLRDDVLTDLPPLTVQRVLTPLTAKQKTAYNRLRKEALAELPDGTLKVAWTEGEKHVMLHKLTTGLGVMDSDGELLKESGKLDRLREDLSDRARPTLVVAHYRASVEAAYAVAASLGAKVDRITGATSSKDRARIVRSFQHGELDVLCASLETIAEGLTLTAADMIIFLETSWRPSRNEQAMRRIHRLGQTRPCTMLDYVTPDTVDEKKRVALKDKLDHQARVLTWGQVRDLL